MTKRTLRTIKPLNKKGKISRKAIREAVKTVLEQKEAARKAAANGSTPPPQRHWSEEEEAYQ